VELAPLVFAIELQFMVTVELEQTLVFVFQVVPLTHPHSVKEVALPVEFAMPVQLMRQPIPTQV